MCKISIVTVCYNAERSIKSTIESVLKQTYTDYEYILIDGKSTDNTYKIVCSYDKKFKNRGVQYRHISEQDQGIFDAMNKGIQMARGRYINFMNADDKFHDSEVLETLFANQELDDDVIYGNTVRVSRDEKWMTKADPIEFMKWNMPFCHQSSITKTSIMKTEFFDLAYRVADYNFFLRLYLNGGTFKYVDLIIADYSMNGYSNQEKYKTYLDWILLVYLYEQANTEELLELNRIEQNSILEYKMENDEKENTSQKVIQTLNQKIIDKNKINKIKEQIEYEYPNKLAIDIPTKSSVTKIKQMKNKQLGIDFENLDNEENVSTEAKIIAFEKPKFLQEEKDNQITNAQKGTLTHLCLQKLKPKEEYNLEKIQTLIQNLEMNKIITEKEREAINPYKILQFTKSKIWEQLKNAKEYYQERPFYINVPASEIYNEDIEENVLVQGIIDLYFVNEIGNIVLVDYKTDYVENGKELELVEKYKNQLELYKQALEEALNTKVDKVYIYSVYLEKEIEI